MNTVERCVIAGAIAKTQPADRNSVEWRQWAVMTLEIKDAVQQCCADDISAQFMYDCANVI